MQQSKKEYQKYDNDFDRSLFDDNDKYENIFSQTETNHKVNIKAINDENCGNGEDEQNGEDFYINLHQKIDDKIKTIRSELRKHREKPISNSKQVRQRKPFEMSADKSINVNLFRDMSVKSEMMATFCDQGLKYSGLVSEKKLHPWRKWYRTKEYELFPGESVKSKELIKPIY